MVAPSTINKTWSCIKKPNALILLNLSQAFCNYLNLFSTDLSSLFRSVNVVTSSALRLLATGNAEVKKMKKARDCDGVRATLKQQWLTSAD